MNSLFNVSKRGGRRKKEGENKRETETEGDREWDRQMGERDREKVKEGMGGRGNRSFIGWGYGTRQMVGICEFTPFIGVAPPAGEWFGR